MFDFFFLVYRLKGRKRKEKVMMKLRNLREKILITEIMIRFFSLFFFFF